jgi:antitoxin MazE
MATATLNIKHWGNSLGVRLPAMIAKAAGLRSDMEVTIAVKGNDIVITPNREQPLTLEQRLALFNPELHGAESMATDELLGAEKW